ncbi:MAG: zf-HC2 domain-containing protein [Planctomycetota bacterium]
MDDTIMEFLLRRLRPSGECPSGELGGEKASCPDADLVAGYIDGTLLPDEEAAVTTHLEACVPCRELVAVLKAGAPRFHEVGGGSMVVSGDRDGLTWSLIFPRKLSHRRRLFLVAAAVVVVGFTVVWLMQRGRTGTSEQGPREILLAELSERLAREYAGTFGGFRPLGSSERLSSGPGPLRSDLVALPVYPAGKILERTPAFRWETTDPEALRQVTLVPDETGEPALTSPGRGRSAAFPPEWKPLEPGKGYAWTVTGAGSPNRPVYRWFELAHPSLAARFERAAAILRGEGEVPAQLQEVLLAHFAVRNGLLGEAEAAARAHLAAFPDDALGRETLQYVLRALGATETDASQPQSDARLW